METCSFHEKILNECKVDKGKFENEYFETFEIVIDEKLRKFLIHFEWNCYVIFKITCVLAKLFKCKQSPGMTKWWPNVQCQFSKLL